MKLCKCGNRHCCHEEVETEIITAVDDIAGKLIEIDGITRQFKRKTCANCDAWLGDSI